MANSRITIQAPSRLHFGLLSFNNSDVRQFGGAGLMLAQPSTVLWVKPASEFGCSGCYSHRVFKFAECWRVHHQLDRLPDCRIHVEQAAPQHVGLGLGTQLGLATAAGLSLYHLDRLPDAIDLAVSVDRGKRSAIGTYGFQSGGFLFELGKLANEPVSQLETRLEFPCGWRVVLIRPEDIEGLSGVREQLAFNELDAVPTTTTDFLVNELTEKMIPALESQDFVGFSKSVTRYGETAGRCFEQLQGGPYASPTLQRAIDILHANKALGVGQSSWGPTIFAFAESLDSAEEIVRSFRAADPEFAAEIQICEANNHGAQIDVG